MNGYVFRVLGRIYFFFFYIPAWKVITSAGIIFFFEVIVTNFIIILFNNMLIKAFISRTTRGWHSESGISKLRSVYLFSEN